MCGSAQRCTACSCNVTIPADLLQWFEPFGSWCAPRCGLLPGAALLAALHPPPPPAEQEEWKKVIKTMGLLVLFVTDLSCTFVVS